MGSWITQHWVPSFDAPSRAGRRGGAYRAYLPDDLVTWPVVLSAGLAARAAEVESEVRALSVAPETRALEGLARFLLRSEAIASSRIEGMQVAPQQLALAELAQSEQLAATSVTRNAQLVANNITTVRRAVGELATAPSITVAGIDDLHHALLPDEQHRGQRTVQNWIGGNDWHPLDAQFVPPPPEHVGALMDDLVQYANGGTHAALIQAGLVHAPPTATTRQRPRTLLAPVWRRGWGRSSRLQTWPPSKSSGSPPRSPSCENGGAISLPPTAAPRASGRSREPTRQSRASSRSSRRRRWSPSGLSIGC